MQSLRQDFTAVVAGATGGIGRALADALDADARCDRVIRLARRDTACPLDITDEASVAAAAATVKARLGQIDLFLDATGALTIDGRGPEKALGQLDPAIMARAFAINAIGPALLLKHFAPLLPRERRAVFGTLSARVGSIGDNRLGGWISYRAAKAALNQIVRTAAIEIARRHPLAVCVALHPGTVATALSAPFVGSRGVSTPAEAASRLLVVLDGLNPADSGGHFAHDGCRVPD